MHTLPPLVDIPIQCPSLIPFVCSLHLHPLSDTEPSQVAGALASAVVVVNVALSNTAAIVTIITDTTDIGPDCN